MSVDQGGPDFSVFEEVAPDTEVADPASIDHGDRRATSVARPDRDVASIPAAYTACDCAEGCPPWAAPGVGEDALEAVTLPTPAEGDRPLAALVTDEAAADRLNTHAAATCPSPRPPTVKEAGRAYATLEGAAYADPDRRSRPERALATYARILKTDRHLQAVYDGLTTVLVSLRVSPTHGGGWTPPLELADRVTDPNPDVRRRLVSRLEDTFDVPRDRYEWVRVVTGTRSAATPHVHWFIWAEDPQDDLAVECGGQRRGLRSLRDAHVGGEADPHADGAVGAYPEDHRVDPEGDEGTVTVRHEAEQRDDSETPHPEDLRERGHTPLPCADRATRGAVYVASQLVHLKARRWVSGGAVDDPDRKDHTAVEAAATAVLHERDWFAHSQGADSRFA